MTAKTVFLDTNTLLHFKSPEQIDWLTLLSATSVLIVISVNVVAELDKHKRAHHSKRTQSRARSAAARIVDQNGTDIRPLTKLCVWARTPTLDYVAHHLDRLEQDDVLLASIIEYTSENASDIVLISDDGALLLRAKAHSIATSRLPEAMRLPDEPDPLEKENRDLRKALERLERATPLLRLAFEGGSNTLRAALPSLASVEAGPWPTLRPRGESSRDFLRSPQDDRDADDRQVQRRVKLMARAARTLPLAFTLSNDGDSPASDIDLSVRFPIGVEVNLGHSDENPNVSLLTARRSTSGAILSVRFTKLKHHQNFTIRLTAEFSDRALAKSFACSYGINAGNQIDDVTGDLHVVVEPASV